MLLSTTKSERVTVTEPSDRKPDMIDTLTVARNAEDNSGAQRVESQTETTLQPSIFSQAQTFAQPPASVLFGSTSSFEERFKLTPLPRDASPALRHNMNVAITVLERIYTMDIAPTNTPLSPHRFDKTDCRVHSLAQHYNAIDKIAKQIEMPLSEFNTLNDEKSINEVFKREQYSESVYSGVRILNSYLNRTDDNELHGANCAQLADLSFVMIGQMPNNVAVEVMALESEGSSLESGQDPDHVFNVLGRDQTSDSSEFSSWNNDAVVLDVHARRVYPATHLKTEMEKIPEFSLNSHATELITRHPANTTFPIAPGQVIDEPVLLAMPWLNDE